MAMDILLYVRVRGRIAGPFDFDQLQALARKGQLSRVHQVSTDQMSWTQAGPSHPEIWEGWTTKVETPVEPVVEQPVVEQPVVEQPVVEQPVAEVDSGELIWHYTKNNEQQEPVSLEHLKKLFSLGELLALDQIWTEGMSEWRSAADVPEFASCLNHPPVTQPPQPPQGMPYPPQGMAPPPQSGAYPQQGMQYPQQGMAQPPQSGAYPMQPQPIVIQTGGANPVVQQQSEVSGGLIAAGYIFAFLFACVGFIIGLVVISKGEGGHGAAILILSIITSIIGAMIGANMGSGY